MHGISIDLGTYSIKFLTYNIDKKSIQFLGSEEIVLYQEELDSNDQEGMWNLQLKVIREFLSEIDYEYQLLVNMPSDIASARYFTLPLKNKKRASMMLPFKVEEDLPYSINECHFAESLEVEGTETNALVSIIKKEHFDVFFELLTTNLISPKVLTTDISIYSNFIQENQINFPESFSIIELGHNATRGYFFNKGKLVSNHTSYLAGSLITEAISKNYNISTDEATIYKHQNAFMLTEDQYDQVNENQIEFAKLMDKTMEPLVGEIKRWDIGFRVKHGIPVQEVFLCGGTSNIKNINNYLSSKLSLKTSFFDAFSLVDCAKIDNDAKLRRKFSLISLLAQNAPRKSKLINFLKGEYALQSNIDIPTESIVFIATRLFILSFITSIFFGVDAVLTSASSTKADKRITSLLKNPLIKLSPQIKRKTKKKPAATLKKLVRIEKQITQEIRTIQSSLKTNALKNLNDIINEISGYNVEVESFNSVNDGDFTINLFSKDLSQLEDLQKSISNNKSRKFYVDLNKEKSLLSISGSEGK
jgi:Tfp pilus assembly PilM family ATPase